VVRDILGSSIFNARYAYLRSIAEYKAFPCNCCRDADISGTIDGGDCIIDVNGEKSITNLAISVNFFLGTR